MMQAGVVTIVAIVGLLLAGCGDDDDSADSTMTSEEVTTTTADLSIAGSDVTIEVLEEEDPGGEGPFTASGEAVDEGVICDAGQGMIAQIVDADTGQGPPFPDDLENLLVDWAFTCDDGSGQFTLQLTQLAHDDPGTTEGRPVGEVIDEGATWEALSGTGGYAALSGEGTLTWEILNPSGRPSRATWVGVLDSTG